VEDLGDDDGERNGLNVNIPGFPNVVRPDVGHNSIEPPD